ncbi:MAG: thiamine-phosphate kinase [Verrucomicrobiae bacterium]|nr:thiamine-phosphate kinase [Verrucomicrobiae bacterium]NNJ41962.1 thiamine-monophosphate kinase [Akkermansiaceae bacterium]
MKRLSDIGEDSLIERLVHRLDRGGESGDRVVVGPGDDCAVVDVGRPGLYQLLKTDSLVEGVHYLAETPAAKVGWKAVARVISDFAAMGGWPGQLLVTIAMPADKEVRYVDGLYRGMNKCAAAYGAEICGGETSSVPDGSAAVISVAGTGWVKKSRYVTRSGGQVGDLVLVTGKLGGSIKGKHLNFLPRLEASRWLVDQFRIRSMMDLSDGLARDLPRLAMASDCGFLIDKKMIPRNRGCDLSQALGDGEDYELLLTVSRRTAAKLCRDWSHAFPALPLTVIGELTDKASGEALPGQLGGWSHFSASNG